MIKPEDYAFLMSVKDYVKNNPEIAPMIAEYSQQGIKEKLEESRELQLKTEVALVSSLARKNKLSDEALIKSLKFMKSRSCFDYEDTIKKLEENKK